MKPAALHIVSRDTPADPVAAAIATLRQASADYLAELTAALNAVADCAGKIVNADAIPYPPGAPDLARRLAESARKDAQAVQAISERAR